MNKTTVTLLASLLMLAGCEAAKDGSFYESADQVYFCGESNLILVDIDQARANSQARVWTWTAKDSPQLSTAASRLAFRGVDDCKPVMGGSAVLLTSSWDGGVAIIRRSDKACIFYARGRSAHSAELIDDGLLAVALSTKVDELRLYDLRGEAMDAQPVWSSPLAGAHGVVWDRKRQVLWALGTDELVKLRVSREGGKDARPSAEVVARWPLPQHGGHDLFPYDADHLAVTVWETAVLFDAQGEKFADVPDLAGKRGLKSISRNWLTGLVMYTRADEGRDCTNAIRFVGAPDLVLPVKDFYKARWNAPCPFSYDR